MHKGQVRKSGTHQELYFKLYQLQYEDQELSEARWQEPANAPQSTVSADD